MRELWDTLKLILVLLFFFLMIIYICKKTSLCDKEGDYGQVESGVEVQ
jgi:hypothetical protein